MFYNKLITEIMKESIGRLYVIRKHLTYKLLNNKLTLVYTQSLEKSVCCLENEEICHEKKW